MPLFGLTLSVGQKEAVTGISVLFAFIGAILSAFGTLDSDAHASQVGMGIAGVILTALEVFFAAVTEF
jgi:hypothetical protein